MTLLDISINSTLDTMMLHNEASHLGILPRYILPYLVAQWTRFDPVKLERTTMVGLWQNNLTALVCCELSILLCTFANCKRDKYTCSISQIYWKQLVHRGVPQNDVCFGVSFAKSNLPALLKVEYSSIPTKILMQYYINIILYIQYLFNVIECLSASFLDILLLTQMFSQGATATLALHESAPHPSLEEPSDVRDILTKCPRSQTRANLIICKLSILVLPISVSYYDFIMYTGQSLSKRVLSN